MISVIEGALIKPVVYEPNTSCLYTRRDVYPDGSYREYSYVGPVEEVQALSDRCWRDEAWSSKEGENIDALLRTGLSFEDALTKLGVP